MQLWCPANPTSQIGHSGALVDHGVELVWANLEVKISLYYVVNWLGVSGRGSTLHSQIVSSNIRKTELIISFPPQHDTIISP